MKRIFISILLIFSFQITYSQENWLFMPTLGVNLTPVDEGSVSGKYHKMGLSVGFLASNTIEEHWSFDYGIMVNQRYMSYFNSEESSELEDLLDLGSIPVIGEFLSNLDATVYENTNAISTYWTIDVPITATYKFDNNFILFGGGYINYLLSTYNEEEVQTHIPLFEVIDPNDLPIDPALTEFLPRNKTVTNANDSKKGINEFGYGIMGGLGYQSENWTVKMNYQYGLSDLREEKSKMKIKNQRTFSLSVAYNIRGLFETSNQKPIYDLELIE